MLDPMRTLALLELNRRFGTRSGDMGQLRRAHGAEIASLLVESARNISYVYLLQADQRREDVVRMWPEEMLQEKAGRLPFIQQRTAAVGPVFKRSYKKNDNPPYGPNPTTQELTKKAFEKRGNDSTEWAPYFKEINGILFERSSLEYAGRLYKTGRGEQYAHPFEAALSLIPNNDTVFLTVLDKLGRWPGNRKEYQAYLAHTLAEIKYTTGAAPVRENERCPLCGKSHTTVYPNALKGAGINFSNMDREGAFPGLSMGQSWKGYSLCLDCADLLYIFKFHLLNSFVGQVAGAKALLLPSLLGNPSGQEQFMEDWADYIRGLAGRHVIDLEEDLMEFFAGQDDAHLVLNILWAKFGQNIDECRGYLTDVLPSRLQRLIGHNRRIKDWSHPLAPAHPHSEAAPKLCLSFLYPLFHRPGGLAAKGANASTQLFTLKKELAKALYVGTRLPNPETFWQELMITAGWFLKESITTSNHWGLLYEGVNKKQEIYWTLAGWVRHLARFLYYLDITGVLPMAAHTLDYEPRMEALKPFFTPESGIDRSEKAFAFLLGILYGKLLQVQGARGVNVGSNALTWLKRLNLAGRDLPELYIRVREKLLSYETESNPKVRELLQDLGRLGALLGDRIELDSTATCYFLLLGQSVTVDVLPSKKGDKQP